METGARAGAMRADVGKIGRSTWKEESPPGGFSLDGDMPIGAPLFPLAPPRRDIEVDGRRSRSVVVASVD
jgi:hypothetical protein